jgi:hypothetical protein
MKATYVQNMTCGLAIYSMREKRPTLKCSVTFSSPDEIRIRRLIDWIAYQKLPFPLARYHNEHMHRPQPFHRHLSRSCVPFAAQSGLHSFHRCRHHHNPNDPCCANTSYHSQEIARDAQSPTCPVAAKHDDTRWIESVRSRAIAAALSASVSLLVALGPLSAPAIAMQMDTYARDQNPASSQPTEELTKPREAPQALSAVGERFRQFQQERQRSNGGQYLLGPLQVQKASLEAAIIAAEAEDYPGALQATRDAGLHCIPSKFEGKSSLSTAVSFGNSALEYRLGDPCVLRLVLKNASRLSGDETVKMEAHERMQHLLRTLQLAEDMMDLASEGDAEAATRAVPVLTEALVAHETFERAIRNALEVD